MELSILVKYISIADVDIVAQQIILSYISVKPFSRKYGIGLLLMQVCFNGAEAAGVLLALYSEPVAYGFFIKSEYKDVKLVDIDISKLAPAYSGSGTSRLAGMIVSVKIIQLGATIATIQSLQIIKF